MASDVHVQPKGSSLTVGHGLASPHSLTYLPGEGVLVATGVKGSVCFYDSALDQLLGSLGEPFN